MASFLNKSIAKIFGTKSEKDIKGVMSYVVKTNEIFGTLAPLSNDELREKTNDVRSKINSYLHPIDTQIEDLQKKAKEDLSLNVHQKEEIYTEIDVLEETRNKELEKILLEVLPTAFAIIKETARRFKENETLEVEANIHDKQYAALHQHVELNGSKAIWKNKWNAAGVEVVWDMVHYDVQLVGGIVLHQGKIAEMATGEGKTLVSTLPSFLNALANRGVHIVTVNNYLSIRDSEWMAPLLEFHGITVDCIDKYEAHSLERIKAYNAGITYGTNNEFGFDYLRDNMAKDQSDLVQKKHHFAMIDEVDSVLVDEARTPLIISGPVPKGDEHEFYDLKPRIQKLVEAQKREVQKYLIEAKKLLSENQEKEGGLALFRAYRGLPKHKPLIKLLSEVGIKQILQKTENFYMQDNSKMMPEADNPLFFTIDEKHNNIDLTEKGIDLITDEGKDSKFFILPDIGDEISKLEKLETLSKDEKAQKKEKIIQDYSIKTQRIHSINQLLKAFTLFEKNTEYILDDGKIKIVDEQTGRVMEGRRYSDGLHQAIEAKESVKVEDATQTYATITLQNYFRMYHKLSGMTGTAETEAGELWEIYKLDVVVIPTNRKIIRDDAEDKVYKTVREKFSAVVEEIIELTEKRRPVLVGTTSVEISELLSRMLNLKKIKHQVLNAKQHQREADIIANAGNPSTVTIATNMAGRGTDIKLSSTSKEAGGLAIIGTERHESRRVDRQLRGRSGRQGDVGSSQFFVSLEDNLMRLFMPERIAKLMDRIGLKEGEVIQHSMITNSIERAQKKVEENNFGVRKRLLEYDDVMNSQREVIYKRRKNALNGVRLDLDILNMLYDTVEDNVLNYKKINNFEGLDLALLSSLQVNLSLQKEEFIALESQKLTEKIYTQALKQYQLKNTSIIEKSLPTLKNIQRTRGASIQNILVPFTDGKKQIGISTSLALSIETEGTELIKSMEKTIVLFIIDDLWKEHLREMDDLKQSVQNAVYEQKDPLLIYKFEGFNLFKLFIAKLNEESVSFLMKAIIPEQEPGDIQEAHTHRKQKLNEQKEASQSVLNNSSKEAHNTNHTAEKMAPAKSQKIANRNTRISVQYLNGSVKKEVKFKTVEEDVKSGKCVIIEK